MIVITGASGNVGRHVVDELATAGQTVRALTRQPAREEARSNIDWVAADFEDVHSLVAALQGVDRLVLISPANRHMADHQRAVVRVAVKAGVKKIAKLSGLGAGPDASARLPQQHYAIEQAISETGVDYAFVRPNLFMQVLLGSAQSAASDGAIYAPAGAGAISFIDTRDVARVLATEVLREGRTVVEVTGPQALTYSEAAGLLSEAIGRPVQHVNVTPEQARASMSSAGMDAWLVEAFLELFEVYRAGHGAAVLADNVKACTDRAATTLARFFSDHKNLFSLEA